MAELVFIPTPVNGHLVSTFETAKRLTDQDHRISVTIICPKFPFTSFSDEYTQSLLGPQDKIKLINLPLPDSLPSPELLSKSAEAYVYASMEAYIPLIRNTLTHIISGSAQVLALVIDFFCMPVLDLANELGLSSYVFFASNPGLLSLFLHLPSRHNLIGAEFHKSSPDLSLPGFANPVPAKVLPSPVFNKDGGYATFLEVAQRLGETKGVLVNSFAELEASNGASSLSSDEKTTLPIYLVGPVVDLKGQPHPSLDQAQHNKIMTWLDAQPRSSVLFLCFGSIGRFFGTSQLREIATGLERSGYRFLWCIRTPQLSRSEPEPIVLPEGFIERTKGRGMVCEWAPQVEVLSHKATGGFVSHCGWNSLLESLWFGVPVATWPIYAEQQLNAFRMVREFGLAAEVRLDYRDGGDDVEAEEIEAAVRRVMEGDQSRELRRKVREMSEMARKAVAEGESSFNALAKFINDIFGS